MTPVLYPLIAWMTLTSWTPPVPPWRAEAEQRLPHRSSTGTDAGASGPPSAFLGRTRLPGLQVPTGPRPAGARIQLAERIEAFLRSLGRWGPAVFIGLFVATSVLCIPGAFLTIAGGALFGLAWGFVYVWTGCVLGASAGFLVSRHVARRWVMKRLTGHPLLLAIEEAVTQEGWKIVALSRLAPGSPFFLLNYLFGLTRVRFWPYLWSTALSLIPGTLLLVYLGSLGQMALTGRARSPFEWAFYAIGLAALLTAVVLIARRAKKVLSAKLRTHGAAGESRVSQPSPHPS